MTEPDAGVLAYVYQARAAFVTLCTLVVVKIRVALSVCDKGEELHQDRESNHPYQGSESMSTGKLEVAWDEAATCQGVNKALMTEWL